MIITGNVLAEGAARSLGKLLSKYYGNKGLGYNTYKKLFDSCVAPITDYASGIWGFTTNDKNKQSANHSHEMLFRRNKYAPIVAIEGDMGWTTPITQ